jgi:four helix bundle protein
MDTETRNPTPPPREPDTNTTALSSIPAAPATYCPRPFDHHRLDAFWVAQKALASGDAIARQLPRGYGALADQLRRALLSAYLGVAEAASRTGADRASRFRCARGEASEAAAALEAVATLGRAARPQVEPVIALLARLCAMLTRLACFQRQR